MRILVDQNISHRIIPKLKNIFDEIFHVKEFELIYASDLEIFKFAKNNKFDAVITLDVDFQNILYEQSLPPKIIWLRTGNCPTSALVDILVRNSDIIKNFIVEEGFDSIEIFK